MHAGFAGWDGESAALGSCALGEAGDDCRRNVLMYVSHTHTVAVFITTPPCLPAKYSVTVCHWFEHQNCFRCAFCIAGRVIAGGTALKEQTTKAHRKQRQQVR